ncbi:MAG TPA: winged helix-turn-helix domain-containing protein [Candidatus Koribacter sp.]|jgi:DNA-binding transcriptional ArsR family regulator
MDGDFSQTAALLSDPGRAAMVMALMNDVSLPAGQLALIGNVAPQTASSHLAKLVRGRLLVGENRGRHRYYRLAGREVAYAVEALLAIAPRISHGRLQPPSDHRLVQVRTCYSHLAGKVAVQLADTLVERRILRRKTRREFAITPSGQDWFAELGIELSKSQLHQRGFARTCLDWTERRDHIAGKLGSLLLTRFRELKWFAPLRDTRALRVSLEGEKKLHELLRISVRRNS